MAGSRCLRIARTVALVALSVSVGGAATAGAQAQKQGPEVSTRAGGIVRWSAPGTKRCGMAGRTWPALGETCYYPIDVLRRPGVLTVTRHGAGPVERARVRIEPFEYGTEDLDLGDIPP